MKLGKVRPIESGDLLERIARGETPTKIAKSLGCTQHCIHSRVHYFLHTTGYATLEQAVAHHVAQRILQVVPLAVRPAVERMTEPLKPKLVWRRVIRSEGEN